MSEADSVHIDVCELAERLPGRRAVVVEGAKDHLTLLLGGHVAGEQDAGLLEEKGNAVSWGRDDARAQALKMFACCGIGARVPRQRLSR
jgi:hypothetical protein